MFANHINVLITDIDVGALQNKVDQIIIELKSWFQKNDLKINVDKQWLYHFIADKKGSSRTSSYFQYNESNL